MSAANVLTVRNPFDGSVVGEVPLADAAAVDAAVTAAQKTYEQTRRMPPWERAGILSKAAQILQKRRDDFAQTIMAEAGKPIVLAEGEVDRAIVTLTAAAEEARHSQGQWLDIDAFPNGKGHVGFVKRFPIGVIYGMTPFNFPLNLAAHKVAPAVATGNTIILKPSPRTPFSAIKLAEIFAEAGAPAGQVIALICPNDLAMRVVDDERVKHVSFTGSVPIGWEIKKRAALKRVTLELGGNAALIVHDDADLSAAVATAAGGAYSYAGQSCISVQRIFVQQKIYSEFREKLVNHIREKIRCGDPRDRSVMVGPMIDPSALTRVRSLIDEAKKSGAKLLVGGEIIGPCITPALLENVDPKSPICATEVFAPIATLHSYDQFDQAIAAANDSVFGLQAGVFTRDISRAWHAFEMLDVGGVMINQAPTWRTDTMPYGGIKQSGFGREGVRSAMIEMTEEKTLVMRIE